MIKIGKDISKFSSYSCRPADKSELREIIKSRIEKDGPNCNLNDIDTFLIPDMSYLFSGDIFDSFNGDISEWNVSNVKHMEWMFYCSSFNGDISKWNVSNVKFMQLMFANSSFNGGISEWDVRHVKRMNCMFAKSKFNHDISKWNVSNVINMSHMFNCSKFNQDISNWKLKENCNTSYIFYKCPIKEEFKPKSLQK